jgi:hypothetical protein
MHENNSFDHLVSKITFTSLRSTLRETLLSVWAQYTNGLSSAMVTWNNKTAGCGFANWVNSNPQYAGYKYKLYI